MAPSSHESRKRLPLILERTFFPAPVSERKKRSESQMTPPASCRQEKGEGMPLLSPRSQFEKLRWSAVSWSDGSLRFQPASQQLPAPSRIPRFDSTITAAIRLRPPGRRLGRWWNQRGFRALRQNQRRSRRLVEVEIAPQIAELRNFLPNRGTRIGPAVVLRIQPLAA